MATVLFLQVLSREAIQQDDLSTPVIDCDSFVGSL